MAIDVHDRESGPYAGNGVSRQFVVDFHTQAAEHIAVQVIRAGGQEEFLELGTDYGVLLNPDQNENPGGVVSLAEALPVGDVLFIYSNAPYVQPLDLQQNQAYFTDSVEDALDNQNIQIQQLAREMERAVRFPRRALPVPTLPLPQPNTVIGLDENSNPYLIPIAELGGGGGGGGGCCTPFMNIDGGGAFTSEECFFVNFNWNATDDCVGNPVGPPGPVQPPTMANPVTLQDTYSVFAGGTISTQDLQCGIAFGAPNDPWGVYVYDRSSEFVDGSPQLRPSPRRIGDWVAPELAEDAAPTDFIFEADFGAPPNDTDGTTIIETTAFAAEVSARFAVRVTTNRTTQSVRTTNFFLRVRRASNMELLGQSFVTLTNSHIFNTNAFTTVRYNAGGQFLNELTIQKINGVWVLKLDRDIEAFPFNGWTYSNGLGQNVGINQPTPFPFGIDDSDIALRPTGAIGTVQPGVVFDELVRIPSQVNDSPVSGNNVGLRIVGNVPSNMDETHDFFAQFQIVRISTNQIIGGIVISLLVERSAQGVAPIGPATPPTYTVPAGSNIGQLTASSATSAVASVQINTDGKIYTLESDNASPSSPVEFADWVTGDFDPALFEVRVTGVTGLNILQAAANVWHPLSSGSATYGLDAASPPTSQFRSGSATIQIRLASTGAILAQYPFSALVTIGT